MNWKEETVERLRRYPAMANAVKSIPMQMENLALEAQSLQSMQPGRFGGGNKRAQEDRLLNIFVQQQELALALQNAQCWVEITERALRRQPERDRALLRMLYVENQPAAQICELLGMEKSSLYRHRDTALKNLTLSIYGALES